MKAVIIALIALPVASAQQTSFEELARLFQNDPGQPPEEAITTVQGRPGVRIFEYSFASPVAGRVPGLLVVPARRGRFPVILYGHWMMPGSPMRNRTEFLEEAVVMARAGALCVLLDSPLVREGVKDDPGPGQGPNAQLQMAREWRRSLDLILARRDVDPARVAYVGHSFNAGVGAKLTAVEKRIRSFVLMANQYSLREYIYDDENPEMVAERRKLGEERTQSYLRKFPWDDSLTFVQRSGPAAVFLQYGRTDKPLPERIARKSFARFQEPKHIEFYDAGHELNAAARLDRAKWLQERLGLKRVDLKALASIPQLR